MIKKILALQTSTSDLSLSSWTWLKLIKRHLLYRLLLVLSQDCHALGWKTICFKFLVGPSIISVTCQLHHIQSYTNNHLTSTWWSHDIWILSEKKSVIGNYNNSKNNNYCSWWSIYYYYKVCDWNNKIKPMQWSIMGYNNYNYTSINGAQDLLSTKEMDEIIYYTSNSWEVFDSSNHLFFHKVIWSLALCWWCYIGPRIWQDCLFTQEAWQSGMVMSLGYFRVLCKSLFSLLKALKIKLVKADTHVKAYVSVN